MEEKPKNKLVEQEKETLSFWKERGIFDKTLEKNKSSGKEFIFYEGPPTANGHPGIHHLEARVFKDALPRYKTMRGYYVRRKGGWDTHGLPVEIAVEKALGLTSKKEIEAYGIAPFNEKCKESVWKYVSEWEEFTNRMGYWVDITNPYITYKPSYIESLWNIVKHVHSKGLLYKDYKVVPWCPRCGTGLSSHELAQGYQDVKDLSVYVKFPIRTDGSEAKPAFNGAGGVQKYLLAWTTTPWTLPGNVGLAVGEKIEYVEVEMEDGVYILARERLSVLKGKEYKEIQSYKGKELVGLSYKPLYPFITEHITGAEKEKMVNAYKVYAADFVTTADGTGIVHTAVMYGQDDFELGNKVGLPKFHLVSEDGTFKKEAGEFAGKFVKDEATDVALIKDLAHRGLLFGKEKYEHSYPFCWRCKTPLIYFARDSWYIKMSALRDTLVKENEGINWEPAHIKEGRFGEWLREIKDWAISRERYWGTPLPLWSCQKCHAQKVVGSIAEIIEKTTNEFFLMRHGQSENNVVNQLCTVDRTTCGLTEKGKQQAKVSAQKLVGKDIIAVYCSPFRRTKETAEIAARELGVSLTVDERIREIAVGQFDGKTVDEFHDFFADPFERFTKKPAGGETFAEVKRRMGDFLYDIALKHKGGKVLIVTHEAPASLLFAAAHGLSQNELIAMWGSGWGSQKLFMDNAEVKHFKFNSLPHNADFELDLHRPYIDEVKFICTCGGTMTRTKEVMDVWFDSGAMPFAQDHYPFEHKAELDGGIFKKAHGYPADFISEAIDQTRGWFYTLHAIGVLMGKGKAFKNVICLGHILDGEGKKMSKSLGNVVDPFMAMEKFGADPLRFWMYSVNAPGDSKNFDERTVDEVVKKVFNLASNVLAFYQLYAPTSLQVTSYKLTSHNVLDRWILARLAQLTEEVTSGLEQYKLFEPTRAIKDFIADLSQWYLRRSRDRMKGITNNELGIREDAETALATTRFVLLELSKLMAPFTPFFAEYLYKQVGGEKESVHLEDWTEALSPKPEALSLLKEMEEVRKTVSLALEARARANMKVRQPLQKLQVTSYKLQGQVDLLSLLKDEVNVKEINFGNELILDTTITPELKKEGEVREMIRRIQELRKEKGLKPGEPAVLVVNETVSVLLKESEEEIKKAASLSRIEYDTATTIPLSLK